MKLPTAEEVAAQALNPWVSNERLHRACRDELLALVAAAIREDRRRVLEAAIGVIEGGSFLHDDAPDRMFARDVVLAIRRALLSEEPPQPAAGVEAEPMSKSRMKRLAIQRGSEPQPEPLIEDHAYSPCFCTYPDHERDHCHRWTGAQTRCWQPRSRHAR